MPATGGEPTRLTFHPGIDAARGWSPDGRRVLFASTRDTVPVPGLPSIFRLWSVASAPTARSPRFRKRCRCRARSPAPIHPMAAASPTRRSRLGVRGRLGAEPEQPVAALSRRAHASDPGDQLSPTTPSRSCRGPTATTPRRCGSATRSTSSPIATARPTCSATSRAPRRSQQLTRHDDFDVMNASARVDAIVYEQGGDLHLFDIGVEAGAAARRSRSPAIFRGRVRSSRRSPA